MAVRLERVWIECGVWCIGVVGMVRRDCTHGHIPSSASYVGNFARLSSIAWRGWRMVRGPAPSSRSYKRGVGIGLIQLCYSTSGTIRMSKSTAKDSAHVFLEDTRPEFESDAARY